MDTNKLEAVVEWMRLHGVKGYTEHPSGFSLELFEDQVTPQIEAADGRGPYEDAELYPDGIVPRLRRLRDE